MKVNDDTMSVAAHFFRNVQFLGLSGSSGPSQDTCCPLHQTAFLQVSRIEETYQVEILYRPSRLLSYQLWPRRSGFDVTRVHHAESDFFFVRFSGRAARHSVIAER